MLFEAAFKGYLQELAGSATQAVLLSSWGTCCARM